MKKVKPHNFPADQILKKYPNGKMRKKKWNYRFAVECLSYIQDMIWPYITMTVQQRAIFFNDPSQEHEVSVKIICGYLLKTKVQGINLRSDKTKGLECYVDADWAE